MSLNEEIMKIKEILGEHGKRLSKLESLIQTKPETTKKKTSIKEFLLSKKPSSDVEKALAIGYYLEKYENFSSFTAKDLEEGFRDAKEPIPPNIWDKIQLNVKKGHMMEKKEKKANLKSWNLTNSGEKHVENDFESE